MSVYFLSLCWVHLICSVVLTVIVHTCSSLYNRSINVLLKSERFLDNDTHRQYNFEDLKTRSGFTLKENSCGICRVPDGIHIFK